LRERARDGGDRVETRILDGKPIAAGIREEVAERAGRLRGRGRVVRLAVVLSGDDPASRVYSESILKAAARLGVEAGLHELEAGLGADAIAAFICRLSEDPDVSGIIVQRPLPPGVPESVSDGIAPAKDVDCVTARSQGLLATGREAFAPATPLGVIETLVRSGITIPGSHVVIVGRSAVVGRPLASLLLRKSPRGNATVTVCHTGTLDLASHTRRADILVAAMGRPETVRGDMIREGTVVIDVGVNRVADPAAEGGHRIVGDVAFDEMLGRASAVTPVPGGVGRLTTALLLRNTVEAAEQAAGGGGS
jgi:methylenetetrahydrofolate dehydrogenase (NADP+)/methenyltetrahydrofolate cyclohydrolase